MLHLNLPVRTGPLAGTVGLTGGDALDRPVGCKCGGIRGVWLGAPAAVWFLATTCSRPKFVLSLWAATGPVFLLAVRTVDRSPAGSESVPRVLAVTSLGGAGDANGRKLARPIGWRAVADVPVRRQRVWVSDNGGPWWRPPAGGCAELGRLGN